MFILRRIHNLRWDLDGCPDKSFFQKKKHNGPSFLFQGDKAGHHVGKEHHSRLPARERILKAVRKTFYEMGMALGAAQNPTCQFEKPRMVTGKNRRVIKLFSEKDQERGHAAIRQGRLKGFTGLAHRQACWVSVFFFFFFLICRRGVPLWRSRATEFKTALCRVKIHGQTLHSYATLGRRRAKRAIRLSDRFAMETLGTRQQGHLSSAPVFQKKGLKMSLPFRWGGNMKKKIIFRGLRASCA